MLLQLPLYSGHPLYPVEAVYPKRVSDTILFVHCYLLKTTENARKRRNPTPTNVPPRGRTTTPTHRTTVGGPLHCPLGLEASTPHVYLRLLHALLPSQR